MGSRSGVAQRWTNVLNLGTKNQNFMILLILKYDFQNWLETISIQMLRVFPKSIHVVLCSGVSKHVFEPLRFDGVCVKLESEHFSSGTPYFCMPRPGETKK